MKKTFLNRCISIMVMLSLVTGSYAQNKSDADRSQKSVEEHLVDFKDGQQSYKIKMKSNAIIELYVDDKLIPKEAYIKYNEVIQKFRVQVKKAKEMAEQDKRQASKEQYQSKLEREEVIVQKQKAGQDARQAEKYKMQVEQTDRQTSKKAMEQSGQDQERVAAKNKELAEQDARQVQNYKRQVEETDRQMAMKAREQSKQDQVESGKYTADAAINAKIAEEDRRMLHSLLSDLVKENIISTDKDASSIILTEDEFTVNGKKQPASLHDKFKALYLKKKGMKINYHNENGSSNFSIDNDDDIKR